MSLNPDATLDLRAKILDIPYTEGDTVQFSIQYPTANFDFSGCTHKIDIRDGENVTSNLLYSLTLGNGLTAAIVGDQWLIVATLSATQSAALQLAQSWYAHRITYAGGIVRTYVRGQLLPDPTTTGA